MFSTNPKIRRAVGVAVVSGIVLSGCGGESASQPSSAPEPAIGSAGADAAAFPVSIEHKFGTTTVPAEPRRVLSLGYQEHDTILALGVTPIAVRYWYGDESDVIFPWAEDEAGGATPEILKMDDGVNFEKVAALRPDLILGVYSGMTAEDFAKLSAIARQWPRPTSTWTTASRGRT